MSVIKSPTMILGVAPPHPIDQSIRFNDDDSAYMYKTFSGVGDNRRKYSISVWFKIGEKGDGSNNTERNIFMAGAYGNDDGITLDQNDKIKFSLNGTSSANLISTQVLRDHSAFYHVMVAVDTTDSFSSDRVKMYLNGSRITDFATSNYPSLNYDGNIVNNVQHNIGARTGSNRHFDGYLAEIALVDGQTLDPSSFGLFNDSNIWIPKNLSDLTFGTNGFHIKGESASDLGNDSSGNNNDFTTSGLTSDDQQPDSPTNNHAVFNPLDVASNGFTTFSEGNLAITYSGASARELARSSITIPASTDGFFEVKITATLGSGVDFALGIEDGSAKQDASNTTYTNAYVLREDGTFSTKGSSSSSSYGVSFTNNDVIGVWRKANGDLLFYKNGTVMNSGTPAITSITEETHFVAGGFNGGSGIGRFASSQWTNKPTGVADTMALNTKNLGG